MKDKSLIEKVHQLGLAVETVVIPGHERAYRVYKGAKQIFIGTEEAVKGFLVDYERTRPGPLDASLSGYRE